MVPSRICRVGRNWDSKEWIGNERRAFFRAFQDGKTLHLFVDVKDDSPTGSPALEPWEQDCVELFFDAAPDGSVTKYDGNVGRLFIMPRLAEDKMLKAWPGDLKLSVRDVAVKVVQTADGYTAEIAIPLASLLLNGMLEGRRLGFDIQIDDMKDKKRNMFFWSSQGTAFSDRSAFGVLVFE